MAVKKILINGKNKSAIYETMEALRYSIKREVTEIPAEFYSFAEKRIKLFEEAARKDAQWQNRTGKARKLINAKLYTRNDKLIISLAHGTYDMRKGKRNKYGIYLEAKPQYAILKQTLITHGPRVISLIVSDINRSRGAKKK